MCVCSGSQAKQAIGPREADAGGARSTPGARVCVCSHSLYTAHQASASQQYEQKGEELRVHHTITQYNVKLAYRLDASVLKMAHRGACNAAPAVFATRRRALPLPVACPKTWGKNREEGDKGKGTPSTSVSARGVKCLPAPKWPASPARPCTVVCRPLPHMPSIELLRPHPQMHPTHPKHPQAHSYSKPRQWLAISRTCSLSSRRSTGRTRC